MSARLPRRRKPATFRPHGFDSLESRMLMSAAVSKTAVVAGAGSAAQATVKPVINTLQKASKSLQKVAMATEFSALAKFAKPTGDVVNTIQPTKYTPFVLDLTSIAEDLNAAPKLGTSATGLTIAVPSPDGSLKRFSVFQSSMMAPEMEAQTASYIRTFTGVGIDDPTQNIVLDYTTLGFHASVLGPGGDWYVDPYWHRDTAQYASYYKSDLQKADDTWMCLIEEDEEESAAAIETALDAMKGRTASSAAIVNPLVSGTQLRTYEIGIATTGEYTAFQGGTFAASLSAVTSLLARMNQVYERDLAVHMNFVTNQSALIFTSASSDPFTNVSNPDTTNGQLQTRLDSVIGSANYDLGHVVHKASSGNDNGLAGGIGTVGTAGIKGEGYSAAFSPTTDPFTIDYVCHEVGHQFAGRHNFSSAGGGPGDFDSLAVEPGSGTTIMSYAGIGESNENIQANSDAMFNSINYEQITNFITGATRGATITASGNAPPTAAVSGPTSYTIPARTPFALTAIGTDANPEDVLTYSWEQRNGAAGILAVPSASSTTGPAFRPYLPSPSPTRVFPRLSTILTGGVSTFGETLPNVARTMNFTVMVRDNHVGAGGAATLSSLVSVTTVATGSAFAFSNLNSAATLIGGSNQAITWNVAGTTAAQFNAATVNILLSLDGGQTFTTTLASNVPNDGSETVQLPYGVGSSQARIKIQPTGNIFFDINNANLTITNVAVPASVVPGAPLLVAASDTGVSSSDGITKNNNVDSATALTFSVPGTVAGALVEIIADNVVIGSAVATGTTTLVTTNGLTLLIDGTRPVTARQTEAGMPVSAQSAGTSITVDTAAPTLVSLADRFGFETAQTLTYQFDGADASTITSAVLEVKLEADSSAVPTIVSYDAGTGTAIFSFNGILADGDYEAKLLAGLVTDAAGNGVVEDEVHFFVLAGDANRNRVVDFDDLVVLSQNYAASGKTFSQGNFNYSADGLVDFDDLVILSQQYNKSLPGLSIAANLVSPPTTSTVTRGKGARQPSVASGIVA